MSGIGTNFGVHHSAAGQTTPATAATSTTLQALGRATGPVLTAHHTIPGRVPTPPRFEIEMGGSFIAFKMEGVKDGPVDTSNYKKAVYRLFFADEFSAIKCTATFTTKSSVTRGVDFANAFMAEAAGYGIDGQVFCATACIVKPQDTFRDFVSKCMTQACGSSERAVESVHRDQVKANVELILAKAESDNQPRLYPGTEFLLGNGLAQDFANLAKSAAEAKSLASYSLMHEVAIHHLSQLRGGQDLDDLTLAAMLVSCLHSLKIRKEAMRARLAASPVQEVKARAELL